MPQPCRRDVLSRADEPPGRGKYHIHPGKLQRHTVCMSEQSDWRVRVTRCHEWLAELCDLPSSPRHVVLIAIPAFAALAQGLGAD